MKIPKSVIKGLYNWTSGNKRGNGRGIDMYSLISYFHHNSRAKLFSTDNGEKSYFITIGKDTCEIKDFVDEMKDRVRLYRESLEGARA